MISALISSADDMTVAVCVCVRVCVRFYTKVITYLDNVRGHKLLVLLLLLL